MMKCLMVIRIVMGVISENEAEGERKIRLCLFLNTVLVGEGGGLAGIHPFSPARREKEKQLTDLCTGCVSTAC